ncbi:ABC transporter ATP-binding protein [Lactobacillus sp. ESL0225]|uniref:ATP-binding cassette domain-containing protein n=1 Tax=Lactobacillus sp. ESL0225 TaxID=2069351 RepID=UPI000EFCE136|nr:ABC transporter ATP-binding protein [Lactobacillus sp. ESL0225]RMC47986.1 ABC transporter ATP-binding protein [Lactobacillus sp. ESL0225]
MIFKNYSHFKFFLLNVFGFIYSTENVIMAYMVGSLINMAAAKQFAKLPWLIIQVLIALILVLLAHLSFNYLKADAIKQTNIKLRRQTLKGMLASPSEDTANLGFLTNDFKLLETNRYEAEISILTYFYTVILALSYALYLNPILTVIFFAGSLLPMLVSNLLQKPIQTAADEWTKANDQYVNQTKNTLAGTRTLNLYGQQNNAVKRDLKVINLLETKLARMNILKNNTNAYLNLIAMGGSYLVPFAIGIMLVIKGFTTLGALFGIIQLSNSFVNPILQILSERNNLSTTKGIVKRITQFGQKAATYPQTTSMTANLVELKVKDLSLIRQGQQLASDIDLTIENGQKIAVIGPSGAGKSTLLQYLLYGDYGQASKILLNHQQVDAGAFTNLFAYSSQNAVIFADTLLFNLTLGADIAPDKIMAVCQGVGLAKLIQEKGLNYGLGDNADQLSGGQLSRIELARAILAQRQILLLDEVNASLDQVTSKQVHDYLFASDLTFIEVIHHYKPADLARYDQVIDFNSYLSS